jgi:sulfur relay (sulfurtransferase) DsrF/TusC family protein
LPKKVFLTILRSPVGSSYYIEGLRLALGILGGSEDHDVTIAHIGSGVRCALRGVDRSYVAELVDFFKQDGDGKRFCVEKESLDEQGLLESDLDGDFAVVPRGVLRKLMFEADFALSF